MSPVAAAPEQVEYINRTIAEADRRFQAVSPECTGRYAASEVTFNALLVAWDVIYLLLPFAPVGTINPMEQE